MLPTSSSTQNSPRPPKLDLTVIASRPPLSPRRLHQPLSHSHQANKSKQLVLGNSLTKQLLLYLTNCQDLSQIQVVAIRNRKLHEVMRLLCCCNQLQIAYLSGNLIRDLQFLSAFLNIRKIDLSHNELTLLPSATAFEQLVHLKLLYLHDNLISEWNNFKAVLACPSLLHLTLFNNPVVNVPGYRHFVVNSCKTLLALDNYIITDEELLEDACFGYRFRSMSEFMKLHLPDFPTHKTATQHLFNLEVDIYRLRRLYEKNSPVIMIQRVWRGYMARHSAKMSSKAQRKAALKIQKNFRGFLLRNKLKNELQEVLKENHQEYLLFSQKELTHQNAMKKIKKCIMRYVNRKRQMNRWNRAALLLQRRVRQWIALSTSYQEILQFKKWPYFYLLREQRGLLFRILDIAAPSLLKDGLISSSLELRKSVFETRRYKTVRTTDPNEMGYSQFPIFQLACRPVLEGRIKAYIQNKPWPSGKSISSAYMSRNHDSQRILQVIKQRTCLVNKKKIVRQIYKREGAKKHFGKILDQYCDLYLFRPTSLEIFKRVCSFVVNYNRMANYDGNPILYPYFEGSLRRVSAAIKIQACFRSYLVRRDFSVGFAELLVERRAASLLQSYWSYLLLRKRLTALSSIRKYLSKIHSNVLYLEEWLYLNLEHITQIHTKHTRFQEQFIDFTIENQQILVSYSGVPGGPFSSGTSFHPQALGLARYSNSPSGCPRWLLGSNFFIPRVKQADGYFRNNINALFHCSKQFCELLPYSAIVGTACNPAGVSKDMRFVKITYSSVEEARRRAYVIAVLTHSFISQVFVRMFTREMLAQGFFTVNVKEVWHLYNIEGVKDYIEPPGTRSLQISRISRQPHNGILLKDPRELAGTGAHFDTTVYNANNEDGSSLFHCSFADDSKSKKYSQYKVRGITPDLHPSVSTAAEGLNVSSAVEEQRSTPLYYNRRASTGGRLNSRVATTQPSKHEILSSFMQLNAAKVKLQREINKERIATANQSELEEKKHTIQNMKEINQAIKKEQRKELNRNLNMFYQINLAEKKLRRDILSKQRLQEQLEIQTKREKVFQGKRRIDYNRSKQEFCQNFAQQKNIITKQMRIGEMIKKAKINQSEKRLVVERAKAERLDLAVGVSKFVRIPLQTSLFDTESVMNLSLQEESKHLSLNQSSRLYQQRASSQLPPIETPYVPMEKVETRMPTQEYSSRLKQDKSVFGTTFESYYTSINYPEGGVMQTNLPQQPKGYVGGMRVPQLPKLLNNQQSKLQGRKYSEKSVKGVFM